MATKGRRPPVNVGPDSELFAALYVYVTRDLRRYGKLLQPDERRWLNKLIRGFSARYRSWDSPQLQPYFGMLHGNGVDKYLKLAGHVFLHIAFDLPHTISQSLPGTTVGQLNRRRLTYVAISPRFPDIMRAFLRNHPLGRAVAATHLGRSAIELISFWAIAMRTVAWVHAEVLAATANPSQLEQRILGSMENAVRVATTSGVVGIPGMHVMGVRLTLLPLLMLQGGPPDNWNWFAIVIAVVSAVLGTSITSYFLARHDRVRPEDELSLRSQLTSLRNSVEHLAAVLDSSRSTAAAQHSELREFLQSISREQTEALRGLLEHASTLVRDVREGAQRESPGQMWSTLLNEQMRLLSQTRDVIGEIAQRVTPVLETRIEDAESRETLARINILGLLLTEQISEALLSSVSREEPAG